MEEKSAQDKATRPSEKLDVPESDEIEVKGRENSRGKIIKNTYMQLSKRNY